MKSLEMRLMLAEEERDTAVKALQKLKGIFISRGHALYKTISYIPVTPVVDQQESLVTIKQKENNYDEETPSQTERLPIIKIKGAHAFAIAA